MREKRFFFRFSIHTAKAAEEGKNIREASNADELRCWVMKDNFVSLACRRQFRWHTENRARWNWKKRKMREKKKNSLKGKLKKRKSSTNLPACSCDMRQKRFAPISLSLFFQTKTDLFYIERQISPPAHASDLQVRKLIVWNWISLRVLFSNRNRRIVLLKWQTFNLPIQSDLSVMIAMEGKRWKICVLLCFIIKRGLNLESFMRFSCYPTAKIRFHFVAISPCSETKFLLTSERTLLSTRLSS